MKITVWSVAVDDDNGTYASVHESELAAYRRLIELTVDSDDKDQVAKAEAFIEAEDFDGLDEWIHEEVIEPPNTSVWTRTSWMCRPLPLQRRKSRTSTSRAANSPACSTACASCKSNGNRKCTAALPSVSTIRWN